MEFKALTKLTLNDEEVLAALNHLYNQNCIRVINLQEFNIPTYVYDLFGIDNEGSIIVFIRFKVIEYSNPNYPLENEDETQMKGKKYKITIQVLSVDVVRGQLVKEYTIRQMYVNYNTFIFMLRLCIYWKNFFNSPHEEITIPEHQQLLEQINIYITTRNDHVIKTLSPSECKDVFSIHQKLLQLHNNSTMSKIYWSMDLIIILIDICQLNVSVKPRHMLSVEHSINSWSDVLERMT